MERLYQFPANTIHHYCFTDVSCIKSHVSYTAAKSGDPDAAFKLVEETASQFLEGLSSSFKTGTKYVAPYAQEATGDNAIPLLLSLMSAQRLKGVSETDIVQLQRVFHTGADPMERLMLRPSFEGTVEKGENYVLVDDVTNMGCTLAELANFILMNGGQVLGSIVLVNAGRSVDFTPKKQHIRLLQERFGHEIRHIFGIHTTALTANEASYLVGFKTLDEIRNRRAKAEKETHLRLLSKSIAKK